MLEKALSEYLGVPYISLFTNGTIPLITAFQALGIKDCEVITTPYSFVATSNAAIWNDVEPVFTDIDEKTGNLDPNKIEDAITPRTKAILPVHVYGNPCDTKAIQAIADKHGLKVIYDAAHAFGVKKDGKTILTEGDISTLSFHATKTYNTVEGGALVCKDEKTKAYIDSLKNFGYTSEIYITETGINGKMDEIRSAYGLLNLHNIDDAIAKRKHVAEVYRNALKSLDGITMFDEDSRLFVALDYPPAVKYEAGYNQISEYLKTLTGFKAVNVLRRNENMGAIENIKSLLATVCENYERFIFTEDDNIFAPAFLEYVNSGLDYFENDKNCESISGFSYPVPMPKSNTTVIKMQRYFSDWGFGTWRDRYFEARDTLTNDFFKKVYKTPSLAKKLRKASKKNYTRAWAFMTDPNVRPYDYTNSCGQILLDRYSIMPKKTLVKNTGWDNSGVHCDESSPIAKVFMEQELDMSEHFGDFVFDDAESESVNKIIDKSLIGAYDRIPYFKTRIKEVLYQTQK